MQRSLLQDYRSSLLDPGFWTYATWLEIVTKYRKSRLGLFWAFFPPALYAFGVGWFFANVQGMSASQFIPHMCLGYVLFRLVTVSVLESATAFASSSSFILDGRTRLTDYVLRVVVKAMFYFVTAAPVIAVSLMLSPGFHWSGLIAAIPAFALVLLNIAWLGVIVAVIGARFPDIHELTGSILMFSFLFTPIVWVASQVPVDSLRGGIARANPLFHLIEVVRAPLLGEPVERLSFAYLAGMLAIGWMVAAFVYRRYARFVPLWV
ncbi:ABC transporter permease [Lysobacter olei]